MFINIYKLSPTSIYIIRHQHPSTSSVTNTDLALWSLLWGGSSDQWSMTIWLGRKLSVDPFLLSVMWWFLNVSVFAVTLASSTSLFQKLVVRVQQQTIGFWRVFKPSCGWLNRGLVSEDTVTQFRTQILIYDIIILLIYENSRSEEG